MISNLMRQVMEVLEGGGYRSIPTPIIVANVKFDLAAVMVGQNKSHDLIVLIDIEATEPNRRVVQRIEGLSRALDVTGSTRPLSTVLVGSTPSKDLFESLSRISRVLSVPPQQGDISSGIRRAVGVLLPLEVTRSGSNLAAGVIQALIAESPASLHSVIQASGRGPDSVGAALKRVLSSPFEADKK